MIMKTFLWVYLVLLVLFYVPVMIMVFISMYRQKKGLKRTKWFPKFFEEEK